MVERRTVLRKEYIVDADNKDDAIEKAEEEAIDEKNVDMALKDETNEAIGDVTLVEKR